MALRFTMQVESGDKLTDTIAEALDMAGRVGSRVAFAFGGTTIFVEPNPTLNPSNASTIITTLVTFWTAKGAPATAP
jgi:hypothetical protein